MAFLDFVKEGQQQSQTPNVDKLPDNVKAQAVETVRPSAQLMDKATEHRVESTDRPSGQTDGKEALMHNQGAAGKSQEAMSPTDHGKSQTATQARTQSRGRGMER